LELINLYDYKEKQILLPHEFFMPFGDKLNEKNDWCQLALMIPWLEIEEKYADSFKNKRFGQPALPARMALGALIIQSRETLSDRSVVKAITENVYMQYFIGLKGFTKDAPFDASLMVHFRKRFDEKILIEINEMITLAEIERKRKKKDDDNDPKSSNDDEPDIFEDSSNEPEEPEEEYQQGVLILDATCTPADIHFPTDLRLLNEARESLEEIIDVLYEPLRGKSKKPRTYRKQARKAYLNIDKKKNKTGKEIRKAIGKQLRFIQRDLKIVESLMQSAEQPLLKKRMLKNLYVSGEVFRQQMKMYLGKTHQVDNRIVSIHMPFVRPIVRGKAAAKNEFGAKLAVSMVDGYVFPEVISFDSFNEGLTLKDSVENYKRKFGCYPQVIMADKIYRNRENLQYCKEKKIRLSGPPLGRPTKDLDLRKEQYSQEKKDTKIRNAVEGKFGEGKRTYGLGRIAAHLAETSKSVIVLQCLTMNLQKRLRSLLCQIFRWTFGKENGTVFLRVA